MPAISSDHINYLVWRYFQEEGLALSEYSLDKETNVSQLDSQLSKDVGQGDLVKLVLKGIQMNQIEAATAENNGVLSKTQLDESTGSPAGSSSNPKETQSHNGSKTAEQTTDPKDKMKQSDKQETQESTNGEASSAPNDRNSEFQVSGLVRVDNASLKELCGGVDSVFNSPWTFVVASLDSTNVYTAQIDDHCYQNKLECQDTPTCLEPLGANLSGPDQCILVGYGSGYIRQWQFNDKSAVLQGVYGSKSGDMGPVLLVRSSPFGTRAAAASVKSGIVNVWDLTKRKLICQLEADEKDESAGDVIWISGDSTIAVAYTSGIAIFRLPENIPTEDTTLKPATWFRGHSKPVSLLDFEQVTQLLVSGGDDGRICIWDAQNSEPARQLTVGSINAPVSHAGWLGIHLLTSTTDGSVRLWDVRSMPIQLLAAVDVGEPVYSLEVSKHTPTHVAVITPSGVNVYMLNLQHPQFTFVGDIKAKGVQCLSWGFDQSLAISTRNGTAVVRCRV